MPAIEHFLMVEEDRRSRSSHQMLRCVQQSRHLRFQTSSIAASSMVSSNLKAVKHCHQTTWHALFHPSSVPCSSELPPGYVSSNPPLLRQTPSVRPVATTPSLQNGVKAGNLGFRVPRGSGATSVKRGRRRSGSGRADPDLFEEWLRANPLPDVDFKTGKQSGNSASAVDALNESRDGGKDLRASESWTVEKRGRPGRDEVRIRNANEEQGGLLQGTLVDNGLLVRGKEECAGLEDLESPEYRTGGFSHGRTDGGRSTWRERGLLQSRKFSWQETGDVLYECLCECDEMVWDRERRRFLEVSPPQGQVQIEFIPPLIQPPSSSCCAPRQFLQSLQQRKARQGNKQLLALLSSNAAALGIFKDGILLLHKVITAYTVRAKQGQSQLKYLRHGGSGRITVGGAIRAREVDRFFARVCAKLNEWGSEIEDCEVLFFSGTTRVWNEVYAEDDLKMPVSRNDSRWCKVPFSIHDPRLQEVQRVFYGVSHGEVNFISGNEQPPP